MTRRLFVLFALAIAGAIILAAFWQKWTFHTFVVDPELERTEMTRSRLGNMLSRVARAVNQGAPADTLGAALDAPSRRVEVVPRGAPLRLDLDGVRLYAEHLTPDTLRITAARGAQIVEVGPIPLGGPPGDLWLTVGTAALVVGLLAAMLVAVPLARSLDRLAAAARRISSGELTARADVRHGPVRELAADFNAMAAHNQRLVEDQEHLLQAVSHELRTPCARIRFAVEMLESDAPARRSERIDGIDRDLDELESLVDELLTYTRARSAGVASDRRPLNVRRELARLADDLAERRAGVEVEVSCGPELMVFAEPRTFRRALRNVAHNALRYADARVVLSAWSTSGRVEIAVGDDGPGIPEGDRERIFEPFIRLDPSRSRAAGGVGLGLAIVRRILQLHGGHVMAQVDPALGGLRLVTQWPARAEMIPSADPAHESASEAGG